MGIDRREGGRYLFILLRFRLGFGERFFLVVGIWNEWNMVFEVFTEGDVGVLGDVRLFWWRKV